MKVLLFVHTGDTRPKCVRSWNSEPDLSSVAWDNYLLHIGATSRWWLVECENADAGRRVIAETLPDGHPASVGLRGSVEPGRILASGGAR